ncbi:restriction endonuclease subunit S [Helicobacter bilis]|uniref:restriction endonuclease subunit S n=1 Tax=Helicobacter bilis TaxID=37372 RepID=UPI000CF01C4A|nr:restriction endonuclease subunit S [Helicobacter bilis]
MKSLESCTCHTEPLGEVSCNTKSSLDLPLESLSLQSFLQSLHKEQWQEVRLGEVTFFQRGYDLSKNQMRQGIYPVAGSNGVIGYHNVSTTKAPCITIGRSGNIGKPKFYTKDFWAHNTTLFVKDFFGNNEKFTFYMLQTMDFSNLNSGSAVPTLNRNHIHEIEVLLPPLTIQQKIAEILSSFDDKIDLLHRQNKTLESLALTLFRHYFIDNPKRDEWEEKPLSEIAEIQNGYAFKNSDYVERGMETYEVLKMGHIESGGGLRYSPKAHYVKINDKMTKWVLNEDDIVLAMTDMKDSLGILGYPAMVDKSNYYVLNQRVARIYLKSKDDFLHNYFLFLYLSLQENIQKLQSLANGGVQVNLSTEAIKNFTIIIPPLAFQNQNNQAFINIIKKYKNNRKQIQNLQAMRDMLLKAIFA